MRSVIVLIAQYNTLTKESNHCLEKEVHVLNKDLIISTCLSKQNAATYKFAQTTTVVVFVTCIYEVCNTLETFSQQNLFLECIQ